MSTITYTLDNGAVLEFRDLEWASRGRLFCQVVATAPDGSILGNTRCEMSDARSRSQAASEFAAHNGAVPDVWRDALLAAFETLDQLHRAERASFAPIDLSQLADPPPLTDVWQGLIKSGLISTCYGDSGQGKSTIVDGLATCVSLGKPFLGRAVKQGPVVILDWELSQDITLHRLYHIARGMGLSAPPPIMYQSLYDPLTSYLSEILSWCERVNPALLIVDSMGAACGGDPMNPERAIALMNALRQLPTSSLVVDHQSNPTQGQGYANKREFGTSYKRHLTRSSLQIEMANQESGKASVILRQQKDNFGPKSDPIPFHIIYAGEAIRFEVADISDAEFADVDTLPAAQKIERFLNETKGATQKTIMEACNIGSAKTFANSMDKVKKRRKVGISRMPNSQERWYFLEWPA
jgi:hypothetical protein